MYLFSLNVCTFSAMKRAMPFGEQVDVSSDESSSSDGDDHKAESEQMSNNIAVDQVVEELVSEGTKTICDHLDMFKCESEHMSDNLNIGQDVEELVSEGICHHSDMVRCTSILKFSFHLFFFLIDISFCSSIYSSGYMVFLSSD